jgi:hypothetical protein
VLDIADTLLQIDFSLVENRVQALWPVLVNVSNFVCRYIILLIFLI